MASFDAVREDVPVPSLRLSEFLDEKLDVDISAEDLGARGSMMLDGGRCRPGDQGCVALASDFLRRTLPMSRVTGPIVRRLPRSPEMRRRRVQSTYPVWTGRHRATSFRHARR